MSSWGRMRLSISWRERRRRWPPIRRRRRRRRRRRCTRPRALHPLRMPMVPPPSRIRTPSPRTCAFLRPCGGPQ
eukprot:5810777-Pleurochrysis_carterae.AAC.1